ncbi:hypothetical protein HG531_006934 [Fusarium graminearum]|nr:hypothetical protein HG531_006934 [Fusarium graminearum]
MSRLGGRACDQVQGHVPERHGNQKRHAPWVQKGVHSRGPLACLHGSYLATVNALEDLGRRVDVPQDSCGQVVLRDHFVECLGAVLAHARCDVLHQIEMALYRAPVIVGQETREDALDEQGRNFASLADPVCHEFL